MKFATVLALLSAAAVVSAAPQFGSDQAPETNASQSSSTGSCSSGTAQCCSTVKDGQQAADAASLLGLSDLTGAIGLSCQKLPINIIGGAAVVDNQCKQTSVCCTGSSPDGLVQVGCTPLPIN